MSRTRWSDVHGRPAWWVGQVTSTSPLEVARLFEGEAVDPATAFPVETCLTPGLVVGDRVFVQVLGSSVTILGKHHTY